MVFLPVRQLKWANVKTWQLCMYVPKKSFLIMFHLLKPRVKAPVSLNHPPVDYLQMFALLLVKKITFNHT